MFPTAPPIARYSQKAKSLPAETVLIQGASGGVGIAAVQLARAAGLHVVGTASSERGRKLVADEGAHQVLDHSAPDHFEKALALTNGRGYDVIIEMLANVNLARDLQILAMDGRVVVVGNRGTIEINPRDAMGRDGSIICMSLWNASTKRSYQHPLGPCCRPRERNASPRDSPRDSTVRSAACARNHHGARRVRQDYLGSLTRRAVATLNIASVL